MDLESGTGTGCPGLSDRDGGYGENLAGEEETQTPGHAVFVGEY